MVTDTKPQRYNWEHRRRKSKERRRRRKKKNKKKKKGIQTRTLLISK